jgi:hypothetical protein
MKRCKRDRAGFAMLLVLAFLMLFFAMMAVAYSHLGSLLRTETYRVKRLEFEQGPATALAQALAVLETGYPPASPYTCSVAVDTSTGPKTFAISYTLQPDSTWTVAAAPLDLSVTVPPLPAAFTAQSPPQ